MEATLSLAFAVHNSPGVFALLLGSGISRNAGVPTGWEVILDLIRQVAEAQGLDCGDDPANWYSEKEGKEADYAVLLEELAKTSAERQALLKSYFEPNKEEREEGKKKPTKAHRAIAEMVAKGFIKIIVTTNFDRLLEQALSDAGIQPTVIKSPDDAKGATPLPHSVCTIIKVHGDYLDSRLKNSTGELSSYDPDIDKLLDRVFDEYGLVICGWSAEWDVALRIAMRRRSNRRYSTYWTTRHDLAGQAKELGDFMRAEVVTISGADEFFEDVKEKVIALERVNRPHPMSTKVAVARLKRYLEAGKDISVNDLVTDETEKVVERLLYDGYSPSKPFSVPELMRRIAEYEAITETLRSLLATGCFWGNDSTRWLWPRCIQRIANAKKRDDGYKIYNTLSLYPACLLFYAGGISALAANNFLNLAALFDQINITDHSKRKSSASVLNHYGVLSGEDQRRIVGKEQNYTPLSDTLYEALLPTLGLITPETRLYTEYFHRFEILIGLVFLDLAIKSANEQGETPRHWAPAGRFLWDAGENPVGERSDSLLWKEIGNEGQSWGPLLAGMFSGDYNLLMQLIDIYKGFIGRVRQQSGMDW